MEESTRLEFVAMAQGLLFVEEADGIATLVINRPEKRNAFNHEMWLQLTDLIRTIDVSDKHKVLVFKGVVMTGHSAQERTLANSSNCAANQTASRLTIRLFEKQRLLWLLVGYLPLQ